MKFLRVFVFCFCLLLMAFSSSAQTNTGRILGSVHDKSGGALTAATVVITDTQRGFSRTVNTDEAGEYAAPNLAPGIYRVRAEAQGFKALERTAIELQVAKDVRIDFELPTGAVTETVTVVEDVPLVENTNDTLGGTISNKTINDLPLNGRDFQNLLVLRPGVQRYPGGGFLSISSNGNRPEDNNFIVDGIDGNDPYYATTVINAEGVQGTPASHLPIDAIQEFNSLENPPAEYGWKPGAVVNVGLKSGTNEYHGTLYDFERNNALDARNFFNTKPDPKKALRLHEFGATLGAPIVKNKLFYFLAYEGVRDLVGNSEFASSPATSPLSPTDPSISIPDAIASVQNADLTPSPLSLSLLKYYPLNNGLGVHGPKKVNLGFPNRNREDNGLIKMDYHINDKNTLTGRYFVADSIQTERDVTVLQPIWQSQAVTRPQVLGMNWTYAASSRWTNEAKFGYNRFSQSILTADANVNPTAYGLNTGVTAPVNFGMPEIAISGFNSLGGNHGWPLLTTPDVTFQFLDNVTYIRGRHTFKFGGEFRRGSTDNVRDRYGKGRIRFEGGLAFDGSSPLEDFIAGVPTVGRIFTGNSRRQVSMKNFGFFVQDDWRVSTHLTINAGLRYDLAGVIKEKNNLLGNFDPAKGLVQVGKDVSSPYNGDHNNFGPRLGIVWDPTGKSKTVVRAGASVIYEIPHISLFIGENGVDNASTSGLGVIPTGAPGVTPGGGKIIAASLDTSNLNWDTTGPIFASVDASCSPSNTCAILGVNRNLRTPYITTWNLNIQQAVTANSSLTVAYVGTKGTKLYSVFDINQVDQNSAAEIACGHCEQDGRPFNSQYPYLNVINQLSNGYESKYHGLQVSYTQRFSRGLSFLAGYTWSHAIDQASFNRGINPQNSRNPAGEYGNSDTDIRHRFTFSATYEIPGPKTFGHLLDNWQANSIVTMQSGLPWGAVDGFTNGSDISQTGEFADRWNFYGNPKDFKASPAGIPYFAADSNAACVARATTPELLASLQSLGCYVEGNAVMIPPAAGTFGTMGRNIFLGPRYFNWDFSLAKSIQFRERYNVQFRAEIFNILNHPTLTNPNGVGGQLGNIDPSDSSFGVSSATPDVAAANPVIGSGGPRAIQLGLKIRF